MSLVQPHTPPSRVSVEIPDKGDDLVLDVETLGEITDHAKEALRLRYEKGHGAMWWRHVRWMRVFYFFPDEVDLGWKDIDEDWIGWDVLALRD